MNCGDCGGEMQPLFTGQYCPFCELKPPSASERFVGFIVFRSRPPGSCEYVFRTLPDATKWRYHAGLERFPIRRVEASEPFTWRQSTGSVRDIELSDRLYEIYLEERILERSQALLVPENA